MQCFINRGNTEKGNAQPSIFDELRGVSFGDETLCRMLDITARRIFISLLSRFHLVMKHCVSCLTYYLK